MSLTSHAPHSRVRQQLDRLSAIVDRHAADHLAIAAIAEEVRVCGERLDGAWAIYRRSVARANAGRDAQDPLTALMAWVRSWRLVVLVSCADAEELVDTRPLVGAAPEEIVEIAASVVGFIEGDASSLAYRAEALRALGSNLAQARAALESDDLPAADVWRRAVAATDSARPVLERGVEVVRSVFGVSSPEFRVLDTRERRGRLGRRRAVEPRAVGDLIPAFARMVAGGQLST